MENDVGWSIALYGGLLWLLVVILGALAVWTLRPMRAGLPGKAEGRCAVLLAILCLPAASPFPPVVLLLNAAALLTAGIALLRSAGRWAMILGAAAMGVSLLRDIYAILGLVGDPEPVKQLAFLLTFNAEASAHTVGHLFLSVPIDMALLLLAARLALAVGGLAAAARSLGDQPGTLARSSATAIEHRD